MTQPFNQSTTFVLNKAHFQECFEQSAKPVQPKDYTKAAIIGLLGTALLFVEAEHYYVPFFLVSLGILEVFSIIYRKPWWVWRQLMGKASNDEVKLTVNEQGIFTKSEHVQSQILWPDVNSIEQTEKGIIVRHQSGMNYLSKSYLSEEMAAFILEKV